MAKITLSHTIHHLLAASKSKPYLYARFCTLHMIVTLLILWVLHQWQGKCNNIIIYWNNALFTIECRDTGAPERGFGSVLPQHPPDHGKRFFFNNYFTSYIKESTCSLETKVKHFSMEFLLNRKHFKILEYQWTSLVQKVLAR